MSRFEKYDENPLSCPIDDELHALDSQVIQTDAKLEKDKKEKIYVITYNPTKTMKEKLEYDLSVQKRLAGNHRDHLMWCEALEQTHISTTDQLVPDLQQQFLYTHDKLKNRWLLIEVLREIGRMSLKDGTNSVEDKPFRENLTAMVRADTWDDVVNHIQQNSDAFMRLIGRFVTWIEWSTSCSMQTIQETIEKLKIPGIENEYFEDTTFIEEYTRAGEQSLQQLYKEVIPLHVYNAEEFKIALKSIVHGSSVMVMDHSSSEKYFGIPREEFICLLEEKKLQEVYFGVCFSQEEANMLHRESPMTTVYGTRRRDMWEGFDASRSGMDAIYPNGAVVYEGIQAK